MTLEKKPIRTKRISPVSFRFSEEAVQHLKTLTEVLNHSQIEIIEALLADEYDRCKKKYPSEVQQALIKTKTAAK